MKDPPSFLRSSRAGIIDILILIRKWSVSRKSCQSRSSTQSPEFIKTVCRFVVDVIWKRRQQQEKASRVHVHTLSSVCSLTFTKSYPLEKLTWQESALKEKTHICLRRWLQCRPPTCHVINASSSCDCFQVSPVNLLHGQWQPTRTLRRTRLPPPP